MDSQIGLLLFLKVGCALQSSSKFRSYRSSRQRNGACPSIIRRYRSRCDKRLHIVLYLLLHVYSYVASNMLSIHPWIYVSDRLRIGDMNLGKSLTEGCGIPGKFTITFVNSNVIQVQTPCQYLIPFWKMILIRGWRSVLRISWWIICDRVSHLGFFMDPSIKSISIWLCLFGVTNRRVGKPRRDVPSTYLVVHLQGPAMVHSQILMKNVCENLYLIIWNQMGADRIEESGKVEDRPKTEMRPIREVFRWGMNKKTSQATRNELETKAIEILIKMKGKGRKPGESGKKSKRRYFPGRRWTEWDVFIR